MCASLSSVMASRPNDTRTRRTGSDTSGTCLARIAGRTGTHPLEGCPVSRPPVGLDRFFPTIPERGVRGAPTFAALKRIEVRQPNPVRP